MQLKSTLRAIARDATHITKIVNWQLKHRIDTKQRRYFVKISAPFCVHQRLISACIS
ncbi:hypothetical protein [Microcoleus sp.]|uniref:hypothetical protein n=1 Tax=Microcoleus sp. TaxID=44472 RepID=UPI0035933997